MMIKTIDTKLTKLGFCGLGIKAEAFVDLDDRCREPLTLMIANALLFDGFIEADSEEQLIQAWQHLHDTGLAYILQGWFGRTARQLIEQGIIS